MLSKTGGVNSINSFDAARIAQHVSGSTLLSGNALTVADVSNNNVVSSFDAAQVARYVTSTPPYGITGTWKFLPGNRTYSTVNATITGEDYVGLLMGEVSGNWTNTVARPSNGDVGPDPLTVKLPELWTAFDKEVTVPVTVSAIANKGVISFEFDLRYDPAVLQPFANSVDVSGTVSRGLSVAANATEPGILRVVVYGPMPIDRDGVLLNLRFTAVGKPGSASPLTWERIMFNEGEPRVSTTDGRIELFGAVSE
jgi:hypothetical protein